MKVTVENVSKSTNLPNNLSFEVIHAYEYTTLNTGLNFLKYKELK